jgi:hypothetical protein
MTADSFVIGDGGLVSVVVADSAPIGVLVADPEPVGVVTVLGPVGPVGERGPAGAGGSLVCEVLSAQLQNGVTATFVLANAVDTSQAVQVFRNGLLEVPGVGFSFSSVSITFSSPPLGSDVVAVVYEKAQ